MFSQRNSHIIGPFHAYSAATYVWDTAFYVATCHVEKDRICGVDNRDNKSSGAQEMSGTTSTR